MQLQQCVRRCHQGRWRAPRGRRNRNTKADPRANEGLRRRTVRCGEWWCSRRKLCVLHDSAQLNCIGFEDVALGYRVIKRSNPCNAECSPTIRKRPLCEVGRRRRHCCAKQSAECRTGLTKPRQSRNGNIDMWCANATGHVPLCVEYECAVVDVERRT